MPELVTTERTRRKPYTALYNRRQRHPADARRVSLIYLAEYKRSLATGRASPHAWLAAASWMATVQHILAAQRARSAAVRYWFKVSVRSNVVWWRQVCDNS